MRDNFLQISCSTNLSGNLVSRFAISMSYLGLNFAGARVTCLENFKPRKIYVQIIDYLGFIQTVRNAKIWKFDTPHPYVTACHISHDTPLPVT